MPPSLSREFLLAAACAVWPRSDHRTYAICAAAAGPLDWARFLRVVRRHRVLGLVHDGLNRAQPGVPPEIVREISGQAAELVHQNLAMAAEAMRLQRLFDEASISVLFLKGTSLAVLAYGDLAVRHSKDIDLLVSPESLDAATILIERAGYRRFDPSPEVGDAQLSLLMSIRKDLAFIHRETRIQVELHWQLFLNPHVMDEASVFAASRLVPVTGTTGLRTLGEEDLFAYLCVHGALHWWNRLNWLADVGALLAAAPEGGAERFSRAAIAKGAGRSAAMAMLLCQRLLNMHLPITVMEKLAEGPTMRWLQVTALNALAAGREEREPHEVRFGTTRGSLSALLLRQSWRYRVRELRNLLINETDVLALPLPEHLWFLYPIIRLPLWIWRRASQRNAT